MNKFLLGIQGYVSCFGWIFVATWQWILEAAPELKMWERHANLGDHFWYAERVNGRLAMLAIAYILIRCLTHGIKLNSFLF